MYPDRNRDVPLDRTLFASELVTIGAFRAPVEHPRFHDSGPIESAIFVFPRTSVEIQHEGHAPFTADTCTITYYNPGQRYTRRAVDPRGDFCEWFAVRPDALREVLACSDPARADRPERPFALSHGPSDAHCYALQRLIVRHVQDSPARDRLAVEEAVMQVLSRITTLARERRSTPKRSNASKHRRESPLVQSARLYLLAHFREPLSLDDIARAASSSVFHLCRVFHREVGITIHRYRHQLRLRRSLELVAERPADLSAIAFHLGFSSHSHFSAAFREAFSIAPSIFRRQASSRRIRELASRLETNASIGG